MKIKERGKINSDYQFEILSIGDPAYQQLALLYATSFWAGAWQELLIDETGAQYGTYDQTGQIYPNTQQLMTANGVSIDNPNWPQLAWQRAGKRSIFRDGIPVRQFWTLEQASKVLSDFTNPIDQNGYGGEVMVLKDSEQTILGFTAYAIAEPQLGRTLAQKRFPYQVLGEYLSQQCPNNRVGIFLDFAIVESSRGQGLGSQLFDARIDRMVTLGAEVIIGRTIKTSPAQYYGNYIARGMQPIAYDPSEPNKAIFAVRVIDLEPRRKDEK